MGLCALNHRRFSNYCAHKLRFLYFVFLIIFVWTNYDATVGGWPIVLRTPGTSFICYAATTQRPGTRQLCISPASPHSSIHSFTHLILLYWLTSFIHLHISSIHYAPGRKDTIIIHVSSHKHHIHPQILLHNSDSQFNLQQVIHPSTIQASSIHSSAGTRKEGHPTECHPYFITFYFVTTLCYLDIRGLKFCVSANVYEQTVIKFFLGANLESLWIFNIYWQWVIWRLRWLLNLEQ